MLAAFVLESMVFSCHRLKFNNIKLNGQKKALLPVSTIDYSIMNIKSIR